MLMPETERYVLHVKGDVATEAAEVLGSKDLQEQDLRIQHKPDTWRVFLRKFG